MSIERNYSLTAFVDGKIDAHFLSGRLLKHHAQDDTIQLFVGGMDIRDFFRPFKGKHVSLVAGLSGETITPTILAAKGRYIGKVWIDSRDGDAALDETFMRGCLGQYSATYMALFIVTDKHRAGREVDVTHLPLLLW